MSDIEMAESNQQDQTAVAAVRAGDTERYRELVERHERRVYAVAWSRLGDATLAEEATQEAFIRVFRGLPKFRGDAALGTWIYRLAVNAALSHRSRRGNAPAAPGEEGGPERVVLSTCSA